MVLLDFFEVFEGFVNIFAVIIVILMSLIIGRRIVKEKKETGYYNVIRVLIFAAFISLSWSLTWEYIAESTSFGSIFPESLIISTDNFSFYSGGVGLIVSCGLALVAYANQWESLYYFSGFFYGGMFLFFLLTGFGALVYPYIYISAIISDIFLILTGFRLKDNGSLGIAIFLLLALITMALEGLLIGLIFNLIYPIFGLFFSLGYFTPFKEQKGDLN